MREARLRVPPRRVETIVPRKAIVDVRIDALDNRELIFAVEPQRIPHDVPGPVVLNFPEFTFDIFEKFFFTTATSQTQTLLQSTRGLIQQVVS